MGQINVKVLASDLEYDEKLMLLTNVEAFTKLSEGYEIYAKFDITASKTRKGCRKCGVSRKGNFCSECGAKIGNILDRTVIGQKWIIVGNSVEEFGIYMDERHPFNGGRHFNKCTLSLEYFMTIKIWYWRGY